VAIGPEEAVDVEGVQMEGRGGVTVVVEVVDAVIVDAVAVGV